MNGDFAHDFHTILDSFDGTRWHVMTCIHGAFRLVEPLIKGAFQHLNSNTMYDPKVPFEVVTGGANATEYCTATAKGSNPLITPSAQTKDYVPMHVYYGLHINCSTVMVWSGQLFVTTNADLISTFGKNKN